MGRLSVYLPPFAPDYSGACSLLFPFRSLLVIHDAQGCTANYTGFDEPRWYDSKKSLYCSGLRKIDVALGNEERTINRIFDAANELKPDFVAIVGSPVPLVMGTDFEGLATEVESRLKIPVFGIATNGLGLYPEGMAMAGKTLLDYYLPEKGVRKKCSVNILGATPLDFLEDEILSLKTYLTENGYEINTCLSLGETENTISQMVDAAVNLAVSQGGVYLAEWFEKYFQIPWMAGLPIGECAKISFIKKLKEVENQELFGVYWGDDFIQQNGEDGLLIIQDEIIGASLAYSFFKDENRKKIRIASPFLKKNRENILYLDTEKALIEEVNKNYKEIFADPLILDLNKGLNRKISYGHFAVSSHFRQQNVYNRLNGRIKK